MNATPKYPLLTDEAIQCYKKALEINPRDAGIWSNLGVTYRVLGQTGEAIKCYEKALSIDKLDIGVWLNRPRRCMN
jgi:tetratricopeptide (TPR) repeat protein